MKFVCENCKAKYQIGDEKVAGKTLRMKCRRCGHMIQVSATVTESSVSQQNPAMPPRAELHVENAPGAVPHAPPSPSIATQSLTDDKGDDDGATVVRPSPFLLRGTGTNLPAAGAPRPAAGQPLGAPAAPLRAVPSPRPSSVRPAAPAPVSPIRGPGPAPGAPRPLGSSPGRTPAPPAARAGGPSASSAAVQIVASSSGLSTGFARAVSAPPPAITPAAPPTEDWYVGIGGVPLGPVRLSVIREKALSGAVDGESLVWREGFDEWQPLKTFPALLAMVDEVRANPVMRPTPLPGAVNALARSSSMPGGAATRTSQIGAVVAPPGGRPETPSGAPAAGAAVASAAAIADPFGINTPSAPPANGSAATGGAFAAGTAAGTAPAAPVGVLADPFSASFAPPAPAAAAAPMVAPVDSPFVARPSVTSIPPKQERKMHPMAWAFIAMCAAFGGVAAWALFLRTPPKPVVASSTPTGTASGPLVGYAPPPPTSLTDSTGGSIATSSPSGTAAVAVNTPNGVGANGLPTSKTAKASDTGAPIDRSGFGTPGPSGPTATSDTNTGGGGQLSEGEISGVVNRNKPGISRRCWDPAFDQSDGKVKSAKVSANVTIGPSGSVQSVNVSGGGGAFPSLASCVQSSISAWQFPPSDGPTTVSIPFGFNHQ